MHTSAFKTCRIHHNGDYDGDIIVTNEDSTSEPIGKKVTVEGFQFEAILSIYLQNRNKKLRTIVIGVGLSKIEVAFKDIEAFVSCMLADRCIGKLEGCSGIDTLIKIARILKVKTHPDILKEEDCPFCVGRTGRVSATCEDCGGSGKL
jgi:hypothetical protein